MRREFSSGNSRLKMVHIVGNEDAKSIGVQDEDHIKYNLGRGGD